MTNTNVYKGSNTAVELILSVFAVLGGELRRHVEYSVVQ